MLCIIIFLDKQLSKAYNFFGTCVLPISLKFTLLMIRGSILARGKRSFSLLLSRIRSKIEVQCGALKGLQRRHAVVLKCNHVVGEASTSPLNESAIIICAESCRFCGVAV